jgi:outer membrane protein TolC
MFMFPGKLGKMGQMEGQMAEMSRQEYESRRWMIASDVQGTYFDLYYLDRLQGINKESQALLKDMIRVTNARYAVGQGMQADVLRPQLQLSKLMNDQIEYKERMRSAFVRLDGLLGRPSGALDEAPVDVRLTPLKLDRKAILKLSEQSPMLKMARADIGRSQAALELAKLGYYPDFELGAGVTPGSGMAKTNYSAMAGVSLPLWAGQKQANQVTEAQKNLEVAQSRLEARRRELDTQINTLLNQIERMESQLRLLNEGMIPQARTALKANLAAYQAGRGDYLMLLDSFMALYDYRMQAAMLLSEHEKMVGMLEALLGQSLKGA